MAKRMDQKRKEINETPGDGPKARVAKMMLHMRVNYEEVNDPEAVAAIDALLATAPGKDILKANERTEEDGGG